MSKIIWDESGKKLYETGVDHGVLYRQDVNGNYTTGVPWIGLTGVTESPSGAEASAQYADNIKYLNIVSAEEFSTTIEAFTYPEEFYECDGTVEVVKGVTIGQQPRKPFGLSYRTKVGNDTSGQDYGYKIHLIYGALASPSEKGYSTINDSPEPVTFNWDITTTPVNVTGYQPTALMIINSTTTDADKLAELEAILYGTEDVEPRMPLPDEVISIVGDTSPTPSSLFREV